MNTPLVKRDILESLREKEYREAFNLENVYTTICFQMRALREQRGMSQLKLGKSIQPSMAQERISILEDPNAETKPTLNTLLRVADGLDVGLEVRFVPFSQVLNRSTHTDMRELEVESFSEELPKIEQEIELEIETQQVETYQLALERELTMGTSNVLSFYWDDKIGAIPQKKQPSSEHNPNPKGDLAYAASFGSPS